MKADIEKRIIDMANKEKTPGDVPFLSRFCRLFIKNNKLFCSISCFSRFSRLDKILVK